MSGFSRQQPFNKAADKALASSIHVGALVKVIKYDAIAMTVNVQPLAKPLVDGEYGSPAQVLAVPIAGTRGGGFIFRPWYKADDVGTVQYLDHDLDEPLQQGGECEANTERNHSDSDAVFLGGVVDGQHKGPQIPDGLALAKEDGTIYLVMTKDNIQIKGDVYIEGDLYVKGNITVTGGDVVADGISLKNHTHSGVVPGGGSTGKPQ